MKGMFGSAKFWMFVGGTAAGIFLKSRSSRKVAVHALAGGMIARDKVMEGVTNIREDAMDLYEDAKRKANEKRAAQENAGAEETEA